MVDHYPDEIGVVKFKDGTYDVYPDLADIPPSVKYVRADLAAPTDAEVEGAKKVCAQMVKEPYRLTGFQATAVNTLIRAATAKPSREVIEVVGDAIGILIGDLVYMADRMNEGARFRDTIIKAQEALALLEGGE